MAPSSGGGPGRSRNNIRNRHAVGAGGIGDNMNKIELTTTPAISGKLFRTNLCNLSERLKHDANGYYYGVNDPGDTVWTRDGYFDLSDLKTKSWSFQVPDDKMGVETVARALGNGMAGITTRSPKECLVVCREHGITPKTVKHREGKKSYATDVLFCKTPVLVLSHNSNGCRMVWGEVPYTFSGPDYFTLKHDWWLDFYNLRPGLKDGGCFVQSSSSSAVIMAEKEDSVWTITLTMPLLPDGQKVGTSYESHFRGAYNWHKRQLQKAS